MWDKSIDDWREDVQESCPFFLADEEVRAYTGCVRERCAWYVAERGECAVKVIAMR